MRFLSRVGAVVRMRQPTATRSTWLGEIPERVKISRMDSLGVPAKFFWLRRRSSALASTTRPSRIRQALASCPSWIPRTIIAGSILQAGWHR
jgi:hypothetical protein